MSETEYLKQRLEITESVLVEMINVIYAYVPDAKQDMLDLSEKLNSSLDYLNVRNSMVNE